MKNILVFFGGESVEHDVSIITGVLTLNSIDREKYNAIPVFVDKDKKLYTGEILHDIDNYSNLDRKELKRVVLVQGESKLYQIKKSKLKFLFDIALAVNCMHGVGGEDGSLVGLLSSSGIGVCSPDILSSSVCMSKSFTKIFLKGIGVKRLPYLTASGIKDVDKIKGKVKYPVIIKPDLLGSSIGISVAKDLSELKCGVLNGLRYGSKVIIEPMLTDFIEINCAVYRKEDGSISVSECERPIKRLDVLSFKDKYENGKRVFPADIDPKISQEIKDITLKVYDALDFEGVIRIDYMIDGKGEIYLNEINTVPGSLAYYLFGDTLKSFTGMLNEMMGRGLKVQNQSLTYIKSYNSGILKPFGAKGLKNTCKKP